MMVEPSALVAPFTGAWIEIGKSSTTPGFAGVAPFTGAWIEMSTKVGVVVVSLVAPFTGAWIEIQTDLIPLIYAPGRSLYGSVD